MSRPVVDECLRALVAGRAVVLVAPEAGRWGPVVADLSDHGRIALFVGTLPVDAGAAGAMAAELFADREFELVDGSITEGPLAPTA
ncbi:MAG TPA: hypothetical protein VM030_05645 [Acidimicrobiales bacterium]|nr:hypothetical protein [Acidimicrobiales bacterium]